MACRFVGMMRLMNSNRWSAAANRCLREDDIRPCLPLMDKQLNNCQYRVPETRKNKIFHVHPVDAYFREKRRDHIPIASNFIVI